MICSDVYVDLEESDNFSLTHVIEPAGDFPVHLVTCSHSDS